MQAGQLLGHFFHLSAEGDELGVVEWPVPIQLLELGAERLEREPDLSVSGLVGGGGEVWVVGHCHFSEEGGEEIGEELEKLGHVSISVSMLHI